MKTPHSTAHCVLRVGSCPTYIGLYPHDGYELAIVATTSGALSSSPRLFTALNSPFWFRARQYSHCLSLFLTL
ncbi:hypothetical protein B0H12DRAFT_1092220 [Mycena haematopus]|nr:hypothetical protein B0H12DRAFT_1092220 [Mycena haematopus]